MQEKFIESFAKARKTLQIADHLTYITYPLIKEHKLLLKILEDIGNSIIMAINSILQYEYLYKRIQLYDNSRDNFETFKKISARYGISAEQLKKIIEILTLTEKHKKSPFEFVRNEKVVIMSNGLKAETLTLDRIKDFLIETKNMIRIVENTIEKNKLRE